MSAVAASAAAARPRTCLHMSCAAASASTSAVAPSRAALCTWSRRRAPGRVAVLVAAKGGSKDKEGAAATPKVDVGHATNLEVILVRLSHHLAVGSLEQGS